MAVLTAHYLSVNDVSAKLGVSVISLARWRRQNIGPSWVRLGPKRLAYDAAKLDAWLGAQERAPLSA